MVTQNEMTVEATLSGSAAKLLLHLLRIGPGQRETPALMRGAGIGDRKAFYAAKEKLQELGLWENPSWCREITQPVWANTSGVWEIPPALREKPTEVLEIPPEVWGNHSVTVANPPIYIGTTEPASPPTPDVFLPQSRRVPEEDRNFSEESEKTARELCQEADLMDRDGDRQRPTSSFQARRNAQVKAICLGWSALFPEQNPLTTARAKQLLLVTDDVAEDVYDALEEAVGKEYPFGYAKKVLESKPKPATSDGRDHTGEKMDWTPEMEAKTRAGEEKMRKMGLPARWFGGEE